LSRPFGGNEFAAQVLRHLVRIGGIVIGLVLALRLLDAVALAGALVGSAGVLGIVIGFAFRDLVENYVSSILLSLRQPFRANDHVVIAGKEGIVVGLTSRVTVLMTPDGNHLTLPNALVFKSDMLNYTRNPLRRFEFNLILAPETSTTLVLEDGLAELRNIDGVLASPPPTVMVVRAARDAVEFQCMAWVDQRVCNIGWVRSEAIRKLRSRLRAAGVQFGAAPPAVRPPVVDAEPREPLLGRQAPTEDEALRPAVEATRRELGGQDLLREPGGRAAY
jgi:small conductance mechanosensitive channel